MSNNYFKFKQFAIYQDKAAMKVGVDSVVLGAWTVVKDTKNILDVGTGTALLSLMLAQKSGAKITAIEINEDAYNQAVENVNDSKWADRVEVRCISLQNFAKENEKRYDLIICNPPYFTGSLKSPDQNRNNARHDDNLSLEDLFAGSKKLLIMGGNLNLIYPFRQKEQLLQSAAKYDFYPAKVLNLRANEKKEPYRIILQFVIDKVETVVEELQIRNTETDDYSTAFKELTKEYYLDF